MTEKTELLYLEPHVNEHGLLVLRDSETKRVLALHRELEVCNNEDDMQEATLRVLVDPRVNPGND